MNTVESVEIRGFWGSRTISLSFKDSVNFLIGRNGTGKTTVINLIAAGLSADFKTLDKVPFERITIKLREVGGRKKPSVIIEKTDQNLPPFPGVTYFIKESASSPAIEFSLDDFEEQMMYRDYRPSTSNRLRARYGRSILEALESMVQVSWLSVHRHAGRTGRDERNWESSVDRKLDDMSNSFVRLFSKLNDSANGLLVDFQKFVFLSLLSDQTEGRLTSEIQKLDFKKERAAIEEIYQQFELTPSQYRPRTQKHFGMLDPAAKSLLAGRGINLVQIAALTGTIRIHSVVEEWNRLLTRRKKIFEPKDKFLNILNSMVVGKRFFINEENELVVETDAKEIFKVTHLSSGEKQLLIVLGQALLQERASWIYIADEPELSLHVSWQEALVRNLKEINPNAQIIFATHSPDIVSTYSDSIIDMEKAFK